MVSQHSKITKFLSVRSAFSRVSSTSFPCPPHLRVSACLVSTCSQHLTSFGVANTPPPPHPCVHISVHPFPFPHALAKLASSAKWGGRWRGAAQTRWWQKHEWVISAVNEVSTEWAAVSRPHRGSKQHLFTRHLQSFTWTIWQHRLCLTSHFIDTWAAKETFNVLIMPVTKATPLALLSEALF